MTIKCLTHEEISEIGYYIHEMLMASKCFTSVRESYDVKGWDATIRFLIDESHHRIFPFELTRDKESVLEEAKQFAYQQAWSVVRERMKKMEGKA